MGVIDLAHSLFLRQFYNPYHDKRGRFTTRPGGVAPSSADIQVQGSRLESAFRVAQEKFVAAENHLRAVRRAHGDALDAMTPEAWKTFETDVTKTPAFIKAMEGIRRAEEAIKTLRKAVFAVDRESFLREAAVSTRLKGELRAILAKEAASDAIENKTLFDKLRAEGLSVGDAQRSVDRQSQRRRSERRDTHAPLEKQIQESLLRQNRHYFGEPADSGLLITGSGRPSVVSPLVPSILPRGGASPDLLSFTSTAAVAVMIPQAGLNGLVQSGRLKNGFEVNFKTGPGSKNDTGYSKARIQSEWDVQGVPLDTKPVDRPIYGFIDHPLRLNTAAFGEPGTWLNYGGVMVVLRPEVRERTVMTIGDSLDDQGARSPSYGTGRGHQKGASRTTGPNGHRLSTPLNDPDDLSDMILTPGPREEARKAQHLKYSPNGELGPYKEGYSGPARTHSDLAWAGDISRPMAGGYTEASIFGKTGLSDISEVRLGWGTKITPAQRAVLDSHKIKVTFLPPTWKELSEMGPLDPLPEIPR